MEINIPDRVIGGDASARARRGKQAAAASQQVPDVDAQVNDLFDADKATKSAPKKKAPPPKPTAKKSAHPVVKKPSKLDLSGIPKARKPKKK